MHPAAAEVLIHWLKTIARARDTYNRSNDRHAISPSIKLAEGSQMTVPLSFCRRLRLRLASSLNCSMAYLYNSRRTWTCPDRKGEFQSETTKLTNGAGLVSGGKPLHCACVNFNNFCLTINERFSYPEFCPLLPSLLLMQYFQKITHSAVHILWKPEVKKKRKQNGFIPRHSHLRHSEVKTAGCDIWD